MKRRKWKVRKKKKKEERRMDEDEDDDDEMVGERTPLKRDKPSGGKQSSPKAPSPETKKTSTVTIHC